MGRPNRILVAGATGALGGRIARLLVERGEAARALTRDTSNPAKQRALAAAGVELVPGDLTRPDSLAAACAGTRTVVSSASATLSRQPADSIQTVDESGQLALVTAAESAGVERFVFISFPPRPLDYALQRAKRAVERRLANSSMSFVSLQPVCFTETWLSPAVGFDLCAGRVRVFGRGDRPISWISREDVARAAVAATDQSFSTVGAIPLCGPDPLSPLDVVRMFETLSGRAVQVAHDGEDAIAARLLSARDPRDEAYAAIMLSIARGLMPTSSDAARLFGAFSTVRDYLGRLVAAEVNPPVRSPGDP